VLSEVVIVVLIWIAFVAAVVWLVNGILDRDARQPAVGGVDVPLEPIAAVGLIIERVAPDASRRKFQVVSQSETGVVFSRSYRPTWTIVVAVLLFPIGLLALIHQRTANVVFTIAPTEAGSRVTISGATRRSLNVLIEQISDSPARTARVG